ncbi:ABC transporter substrate-binding protein [Streptomyces sp. 4N509B]|uniref:ABC transporter substrate-binding protein n=1 Tax=Streptomyces sp. 4N509B TaxID=3457413 RepID=UPI003FD337C4
MGSRHGWSRVGGAVRVTVAAGLLASTVSACGSSPGSGGTLDVWVYQDASTSVQERFVEEFNATSDIDVNLIQIPGGEYQGRMQTAMSDPNPPDIFFNWGGGNIVDFVADGSLMDLSEIVETDQEFENAFVPNLLEGAMIDGRYYGVPMRGVQPVILFYNQTLFDQVGVEPPATFDDFLELVDLFTAEGITPVALAGEEPWTELMWLEVLLDRYGGPEVFRHIQAGEVSAWKDPAMRWTAETIHDLVERGTFGEDFGSMGYTSGEASTLFAEGGAAMHLMGSWEFPNQLADAPAFARRDLAYTNFPVVEGGEGSPENLVGSPSNYWSVNAALQEEGEEDRLAAAIEFLKLGATQEYSQALIDNGDVPTTNDSEALIGSHENPEYARFQYDMVRAAPSFQLSWDQALPVDQSEPMMSAIRDLFDGRMSPDEFVEAMSRNNR